MATEQSPLAEVRVVDAGGALSAYCTRLLADFGAEVRVLRAAPPATGTAEAASGHLDAYHYASTTLCDVDVSDPGQAGALVELGDWADVVIVSPTPTRPVHGLDAAGRRLTWATPTTIVLCLTPLGLGGPLAGWSMTSMTSHALSGLAKRMGPLDGPPVPIPGQHAWAQAATQGAIAVLAALRAHELVGGQFIDLSVHDYLALQDDTIQRYSVAGFVPGRGVPAGGPPGGVWQCRNGRVELQVHTERHWTGFVRVLDNPPELADPALAGRMARLAESEMIREVVTRLLADRDRFELVDVAQAEGVPCGLYNTPAQFVDDAQTVERGLFVDQPKADGSTLRAPAPGFRATPPLTAPRLPVRHPHQRAATTR